MKHLTLQNMLSTKKYPSILHLKNEMIRYKKSGLVFYQEKMSELTLDCAFEFYYYATKGAIAYQNAFPVPVNDFNLGIRSEFHLEELITYFQSYYETDDMPRKPYFQSLSYFKGEQYVWFYQAGSYTTK